MVNNAKVKLEEDIERKKNIELKSNIMKMLKQLTINGENLNTSKIDNYKKWIEEHPNESLKVYNDKKNEIENELLSSQKFK